MRLCVQVWARSHCRKTLVSPYPLTPHAQFSRKISRLLRYNRRPFNRAAFRPTSMQARLMHFIVKVFSEIFIKSMPVRKRMIRQLRDNLRKLLADQGIGIDVRLDWEKIEVIAPAADAATAAQAAEVLARTPGIANFSLIQAYPLGDLDDILDK